MLRTFIKSLGGLDHVVSIIEQQSGTRLSKASVKMWLHRNRVPFRWRAMLCREAVRQNISIPDDVKAEVFFDADQVEQEIAATHRSLTPKNTLSEDVNK